MRARQQCNRSTRDARAWKPSSPWGRRQCFFRPLVERLEERRLLAGDSFELVLDPIAGPVIRDGSGAIVANVSPGSDVLVTGGPDDDTFTINARNGNPLPGGRVVFNGGGGSNDFALLGDGTQQLDVTLGNGTAVGLLDDLAFEATGLAPVDVTGMLTATVTLTGADDHLDLADGANLTIADGPIGSIPALVVSGTSGGVPFETAAFYGNTTVVIDTDGAPGVAGNDQVTVTSASAAHLNTHLAIDTGGGAAEAVLIDGPVSLPGGNFAINTSGSLVINGPIQTSGAGAVELSTSRNISMTSAGSITTVGGDINLTANPLGTTAGNFLGIRLDDAEITSTSGAIRLDGTGGDTGVTNHGVQIINASTVSSGAGATVLSILGRAGAGANSDGMQLTASQLNAVDAAISVVGSSQTADGVKIGSATMTATGSGTISVDGTSTAPGGGGEGVAIFGAPSALQAAAAIQITGDTTDRFGVSISDGEVTATGIGTITISGTSTGSDATADGVVLSGAGTSVRAAGAIQIDGTTAADDGVEIVGAEVTASGNGTVTITGATTSGNGTNSNGVWISQPTAQVAAADGAIAITGTTAGGGTAGDGVRIAAGITLPIRATGAATITITGVGDGTDAGVQIDSPIRSGAGAVTIRAEDGDAAFDDIQLGAAGDITSDSGIVTIDAENAGNTGRLVMVNGTLIDAGTGRIDVNADSNVTLGGLSTSDEVRVVSAAGQIVDGGNAHIEVVATRAQLIAATGIGGANPVETTVGTLAFHNTTSGNVQVVNAGPLTIDDVHTLAGSANVGTGVTILTASSPVTFGHNVTSGGTLTANASESVGPGDDVTVQAGVTVRSTGGNVVLNAGDDLVVAGAGPVGTVLADVGDVTLNSGVADADDLGQQALNGMVRAPAGTVTLNLNAEVGPAMQAASGTIMAVGLQLAGGPGGGAFVLDQSAANDVVTIAGNTSGSIAYRDASALTVGTVATAGIATTDDNVTLCATEMLLTEPLSVGGGVVRLQATGSISQSGGAVTAMALGLIAGGSIDLPSPTNDVDTLAASAGLTLQFADADGFATGAVAAEGCFNGAVGISAGGDVALCLAAGDLAVNSPLQAVGNTVRLQTGGGQITQAAAGVITAANLGVRAGGNIDLNAAPNQITGNFAAASTSAGVVELSDVGGFTVGSIGSASCFAPAISGVSAANGAIDLITDGGSLTVVEPVTAISAAVTVTTTTSGDVMLAGLVTAGTTAVIAAAGLISDDNGGVTNIVATSTALRAATGIGDEADGLETVTGTLAAVTDSGDIHVGNDGPLVIGVVDGLAGVRVTDLNPADNSRADHITIVADSPLTVNQAVRNDDGGNITLTATADGGVDDHLRINADVTVTGGDAAPADGDGNIDLNAGTDMIISAAVATDGGGAIDADAARSIAMNPGSSITAVDGPTTLDANPTASATGMFIGIRLNGADIMSTSGTISLDGTGGSTGTANHGVQLINSSSISSTAAAATISLQGRAGTGVNSDGTQLASSGVTTDGAPISIIGSSAFAEGVKISATTVAATGAGTIEIDGTSTATGGGSEGISIFGATTLIQAEAPITITGETADRYGVSIAAADVTATGSGSITITGSSTGTTPSSDGVILSAPTATITSAGPIQIVGTTAGDDGVEISQADVTTTGSGSISILGITTGAHGSSAEGVAIGGADARIMAADGDITITGTTDGGGVAGDGVDIAAGIPLAIQATGSGRITITGTGDGGDAGVQIDSPLSSAGGDVIIRSEDGGSTLDDIQFGAGGDVTSASGMVTIDAENDGGTASVLMADGALIDAGGGLIDVDADVNVTLGGLLTTGEIQILAVAGGIIDGGADHLDIRSATAELIAAAGIGDGDALETAIATLAFDNRTTGNVEIQNTGSLTIGNVATLTRSDNRGPGATILTAASPIVFAHDTTSGGTVTANAVESVGAGDDITVNAAVTVRSTAGDVIFNAGDNIVISGGGAVAVVQADSGDVTFNSGVADADTLGQQTLDGTISAVNGTITVNLHTAAGQALQSAGGMVTAVQLQLLSVSAGGSFDLFQSPNNDVATIAASTDGSVSYRDATELTVGTVATTGIVTTNDDVTLCATSIDVAQNIAAGTGVVRLQAVAGDVFESGGAEIVADALGVIATGAIELGTATNNVDTFAAQAGLSLYFAELDGFTIGTVAATDCFAGATGITAGGDIELCLTAGTLNVGTPINAAGATVRLQTGSGDIVQSGTGVITVANLGVRASGNIDLNTLQNQISGQFAAASTGAGLIELDDAGGFEVGTVGAGASCFPATTGVTTADGPIGLTTVAGPLTVLDPVSAGAAGLVLVEAAGAAGDVVLNAGVSSGTGHVSVVAGDDVQQNADIATTGGTVYVEAANGTVDGSPNDGVRMAVAATISSSGGNVLVAATGESDLWLSTVAAGTGSVSLEAEGSILDSDASLAVNVQADRLRLVADSDDDGNGQVGDSDDSNTKPGNNELAIDTAVSTLAVAAADAIHVREADEVTVAASGAIAGSRVTFDSTTSPVAASSLADLETTDQGPIDLYAGGVVTLADGDSDGTAAVAGGTGWVAVTSVGALTVNADVTAGNTIQLTATETAAAGDDVLVATGASVISVAGKVQITAGDDLTLQAGATVSAPVAVELNADPVPGDADAAGAHVQLEAALFGPASVFTGRDSDLIVVHPDLSSTSSIAIRSGKSNDAIDVETTAAGDVFLDGQQGDDQVAITLGDTPGAAIQSAIVIRDSGHGGSDVATIDGGATLGDLFAITATTVTRQATETIHVDGNLEQLVVNGFAGSDTFHVTPAVGTTMTINGGSPTAPASPGDHMIYNALGGTAADDGFRIAGSGVLDVNYTGIETITLSGADVTVTGTGLDDVLAVTAVTASSGNYVLTTDGVVGPTVNFLNIAGLAFDSLAGNDLLRIANPTGMVFSPVSPVTSLHVPIVYHGGPDDDALELIGGGGTSYSETYSVGPGSQNGTVSTTNGVNTQTITFTGLEPIADNVTVGSLEVNASPGNDTINVIDGPMFQGAPTVEVNFGVPAAPYELIRFANKTAVTVNGTAGADTINVNYGTAAAGLTEMTVNGDGRNPVSEVELNNGTAPPPPNPNISAGAQNIDLGPWSLEHHPAILDSTTVPHVTVVDPGSGVGDGTFDYYAFTANFGDRGIVAIANETFSPLLYVFDADGNLLTTPDPSLIDFTFPGSGTFVLAVGTAASSNNGGFLVGTPPSATDSYALHVSVTSHGVQTAPPVLTDTAQNIDGGGWNTGPNPDIIEATTIPHVTVSGTGDGSFDYYSFTAGAGERGIFDIDGQNFDAELFLYDSAGNLLAQRDDHLPADTGDGGPTTVDSLIDFTFPAAGTYVIGVGKHGAFDDCGVITGVAPALGDAYELHVSVSGKSSIGGADPIAEAEPNHPIQWLLEIEPNDSTPPPSLPGPNPNIVRGTQDVDAAGWNLNADGAIVDSTTVPHISIVGDGDGSFDYFSFTVANAGDRAIFDIDGANFSSELFLYDAAGNLVASGSSLIDTTAFAGPGVYVIGVGKFDSFDNQGQVAGTPIAPGDAYTLHISLENHEMVGDDTVNVMQSTPATVQTRLNGNEENDLFVFTDGAVLTGFIDGGSGDDLIDWSAMTGPLAVHVTGLSTLPGDGYRGDQADTISQATIAATGDDFDNIDAIRGTDAADTLQMDADLRTHWDLGGRVGDRSGAGLPALPDPAFGPFGVTGLVLPNLAANTGVLIADEADLGLTGNATRIGRSQDDPLFAPVPPQPDPIMPNAAGEQDLAFTGFEHLVGAETRDDRFDVRNGATLSGTIDGRGHDVNGDSLDYRDSLVAVQVDLSAGLAAFINTGGSGPGLMAGTGGPLDGSSIENVFGGSGDDSIVGDQDANLLGDGPGNDVLDGGVADVAGALVSGDDVFRLEPGAAADGTGASNDTLTDLNGNDTVDLRFADAPSMIDMDLLDKPMDIFGGIAGGQHVTLARRGEHAATSPSMFENVVGSQFNDNLYIDPLVVGGNVPANGSPVARNVHGNDPFVGGPDDGHAPDPGQPIPPGDRLFFESFGRPVRDTGFSISAEGLGGATYQSIETLIAANQPPRILDDGDDTFHASPTTAVDNISHFSHWNQELGAAGFAGDYLWHYQAIPPGPNTTTWTFEGIQPGTYRVAATWPSPPSHPIDQTIATDAPFTVFDDAFKLATADVNQQLAPNDFEDAGARWEQLGFFRITSHTLAVRLSDVANGQVLADAIRIERISDGPELTLRQGNEAMTDGGSTVDMVTSVGDPLSRSFVITNDGDLPLEIYDVDLTVPGEPNPVAVPPNVSLSLPGALPSFAMPVIVLPGRTYTFSVTLDALTDPFPGDASRDGHGDFPVELRIFSNDVDEGFATKMGAGVNPLPDDDPGASYDPFTVQIRGVVANHSIVDNGDPQFMLVGADWLGPNSDGFQGDDRWTPGDGDGERAIWTFDHLPSGTYRVSTSYKAEPGNAGSTAAPFLVSSQAGQLGAVTIDQTMTPLALGGFVAQAAEWVDLGGPYTLSNCDPTAGCRLTVELLDTAGGPQEIVIADAVRIERLLADRAEIPYQTTLPDIAVSDGGIDIPDDTGTLVFSATWPGSPVVKTLTIGNRGGSDLVLREPVTIPAGFTLVDFTSPAVGGVPELPTGTSAFTLAPGDEMAVRIRLDAGYPGTFDGEMSFLTGSVPSLPGPAVTGLDPDETPFNFRLAATVSRWQIVDDQDPSGFAATSGFQVTGSGLSNQQGFQRGVHFAAAEDLPTVPTEVATWEFRNLTPGARYRVSTTWSPSPNRATNARFVIDGAASSPITVHVNQQNAPSHLAANGTVWDDLGVFTVDPTGGDDLLVVRLSNTGADGQVIADAVRIEQLVDPEARVADVTAGPEVELFDGRSSVDLGQTWLNGGTVTRTLRIYNDGAQDMAVGTPHVPIGFSLSGLANVVPAGGFDDFTVTLSDSMVDVFHGTLRIPLADFSENPFEIDLVGDVLRPLSTSVSDDDVAVLSGTFTVNGGGFLGAHRSSTATGNSATWTFAVVPGRQYRLAATWVAGPDREAAAPYGLAGVSGAPTVAVDQRVAPAGDVVVSGTDFQRLGIFTATASSLTVTLTDTGAAGVVTADAIHLEEVTILNNEDPAPHYVQTGLLTHVGQGRLNRVDATHPPVAGDGADFTYTGLAPGLYRVSATWTAQPQRAVDAPYTLVGIGGGDRTVTVDQRRAPDDFDFDGTWWEDLDLVRVDGGTLTVRMASSSTGDVVADAVRIERIDSKPEIELIDLGTDQAVGGGDDVVLVDGASTVDFGTTNLGAPLNRVFQIRNLGDVDLDVSGIRLPLRFSLTGPVTPASPIPGGGVAEFTVTFTPTRVDRFRGEMQVGNADPNESPFHINLEATAEPLVTVIDNDDPGYSEPAGALQRWTGQGFAGGDGIRDVDEGIPGGAPQTGQWDFTGLASGTYRVSATWTAFSNRATDAPYTIDGIVGGPVRLEINQRVAPNDFSDQGVAWEDLGIVRVVGGSLRVSLDDDADGNIIADAIRIEQLPTHGPEIQVTGSPNIHDGGNFDFGVTAVPLTHRFTVTNTGTSNLTLDAGSLAASLAAIDGFSLTQSFTPNPAAGLAPGATSTFEIQLDAAAIGAFGGTVEFDNNDADESPFSFAIAGEVVSDVTIIDNLPNAGPLPGGTSYTDSGSVQLWNGQGFLNDVKEIGAGQIGTATFSFGGLAPGDVYQVSATWSAFSNRASAAPYEVGGIVGGPVTALRNQRLAPNDLHDQGRAWEHLGIFELSGNTLSVDLEGSSTGNVIIDAIRIERFVGAEIQVTEDVTGYDVVSGTTTADLGSVITGGSLSRTFTVTNIGAADLILQPIQTSGEFSVTAGDFGVNQALPRGVTATFTVTVDAATAGAKAGTLSFGTNDADESPFSFNLAADVTHALIVDNADPGYSEPDAALQRWSNQGFRGDDGVADVSESAVGGPTQTAVWTFDGLPAGNYLVSTTWTPYFNRATNATYVTSAGPSVVINQQRSPADAAAGGLGTTTTVQGTVFRDLTMLTAFAGGTLTVTLSDTAADGNLIADAIRIERLGPLHAEPAGAAADAPTRLSVDRIEPYLAAAVDYWAEIDATAAARLAGVEAVVLDLPHPLLGLGAMVTPRIWVDDDGAGYGWRLSSGSASSGMDLVTVIAHELGHVLGYQDLDPSVHGDHVMAGTLAADRRALADRHFEDLGATAPRGAAVGLGLPVDQTAADRLFAEFPRTLTRPAATSVRLAGDRDADDAEAWLGNEPRRAGRGAVLKPAGDDRLLARAAVRFEREDEDVRDEFFAKLDDEDSES